MTNNSSLNFNLKLEVAESELSIENLDIDFQIFKNNKPEINKAAITVWNLSETEFQLLTEMDYVVDFYSSYGDDEPCLVFRGYIDKDKTRTDTPKNCVDCKTELILIDGRNAYNATVNNNYRSKVSSSKIIQDCLSAMGVGFNYDNLPAMYFDSFKAAGKAHVILQEVCQPLGINFSVQNNLAQLVLENTESEDTDVFTINSSNCVKLNKKGEDELLIITNFLPHLNPNDLIQCEFDELSGLAKIKSLEHYGNNYGTACTTEITIGVNNNDEDT